MTTSSYFNAVFRTAFFITLLCVASAHAYYSVRDSEPFSLRERDFAPPSSTDFTFTLQDNFALFTESVNSGPALLPASDFFVPADIVTVNLPIFGTFGQPAGIHGDPVANLLYANLKLEKLLADYAAIEERTRLLLGDEPPDDTLGKVDVSQNESVRQLLEKVYFSLSTIEYIFLPQATTAGTEAEAEQQDAGRSKAPLIAFQQLNRKIKHQKTMSLPPPGGTSDTLGLPTMPHEVQHGQSDSSRPNGIEASRPSGSAASYQDAITLPWIIELPFKLLNYLLEHKITALLIGFFCLLLFNFLFGSRS